MVWRYCPLLSSYLAFGLWLNILKMYIKITDVVGEKRIDLTYPIQSTEVNVVSDNVQYQLMEAVKVLLIKNEDKQLPEEVFTDRELNTSIVRKLIATPLDANDNIIKMDKLACVREIALSFWGVT